MDDAPKDKKTSQTRVDLENRVLLVNLYQVVTFEQLESWLADEPFLGLLPSYLMMMIFGTFRCPAWWWKSN